MFSAVEAAAQKRPAFVNRAAVQSEINAATAFVRRKGEDRIAGDAMAQNSELVGFDVVPVLRMKNKPLVTPATLRASVARHFGRLISQQPPL